jgi:hypothetical protein
MLEVQNQALIKTAKERAQRIEELDASCRFYEHGQSGANNKVERELQQARSEREAANARARLLFKEGLGVGATQSRGHRGGHQIFFMGQSLERELVKIDPDGARARQFGAWSASQVSALEPPLRGAA